MFGRRDVAEEGGAVVGGGGAADRGGDVVIAGGDVGDDRAQHIEGGAVADLLLERMLHSIWSKGTWPGPSTMTWQPRVPGALGQLAERAQFGELGVVGGVGKAAGTQAVAKAEGDIVLRP